MRRSENDTVRLQRRNRRAQFSLDMVIVRVDQFEHHPIPEFGRLQHAAEKHLVDPVGTLPLAPVGDGAVTVVERDDEIGARTAQPLGGDRGHIAELIDRRLDPALHLRSDIGFAVDHAADGLQAHSCVRRHVAKRHLLPPAPHPPKVSLIARAASGPPLDAPTPTRARNRSRAGPEKRLHRLSSSLCFQASRRPRRD